MKKYRRREKYVYGISQLCKDIEEYEKGYLQAIMDVFLPVWEYIPKNTWITERELIDDYLAFVTDDEARKDWPETASFVKLALRQFDINELIDIKDN